MCVPYYTMQYMKKEKSPPSYLTESQREQWYRAFGNLPKKKQSPTNALTDAVREYAEYLGCVTARINTTGVYNEKLGKYIFSGATKGVEDIDMVYPAKVHGIPVAIKIAVEIKYGKDKLNPDQKERQEKLEGVGAHYIVAKNFDTFKKDFDIIINYYATIGEKCSSL